MILIVRIVVYVDRMKTKPSATSIHPPVTSNPYFKPLQKNPGLYTTQPQHQRSYIPSKIILQINLTATATAAAVVIVLANLILRISITKIWKTMKILEAMKIL